MKAILIQEDKWEDMWKTLQDKLNLIECNCKLNCPNSFPYDNLKRK